MLRRKIEKILDQSKENNKALLITGARQVGKTYSISKWGKENFSSFIRIDFVERADAVSLFSGVYDAETIYANLSLFTQQKLIDGDTLIFFDEIQAAPEVIGAMKYLVEDGRYRYILSGSLLGIELEGIRSIPVGYLDIREMYPLDFEEFLGALDISPAVVEEVEKAFVERRPVNEFMHTQLMDLVRLYMVVGGMPDSVNAYIKTKNFRSVKEAQESILRLYRNDISKYDRENNLYIKEIFDVIPSELSSMNKRFIMKSLNSNKRFEHYKNSFLWLKDAGVAIPVYNIEEPRCPLMLSSSRSLFKLFLSDVGLLMSTFDDMEMQKDILKSDGNANWGAFWENYAAEELTAHGFPLYYYNSKSYGELDFVLEKNGKAIPIEIKSGKNYKRHKAISNVIDVKDWNIEEAFVFSSANVSKEGKITYLPIYMLMFFHKDILSDFFYEPDISHLK